jgi:hypothetical protein
MGDRKLSSIAMQSFSLKKLIAHLKMFISIQTFSIPVMASTCKQIVLSICLCSGAYYDLKGFTDNIALVKTLTSKPERVLTG